MKIFRALKLFFFTNLMLVTLVLLGMYVSSTVILNNIGEKSNLNYSNSIIKLSDGTFKGLEELVGSFAEDKTIVRLIKSPDNYGEKENEILASLKYAKGLLTATSFAESIDVVDAQKNQIYSSKGYHKTYDMKKRPWYKEAYEKDLKGEKVILTPLHKDYFNDRYAMSIISFIKEDNEIIGCVILNTYMDTFTKYMSELYGDDGAVEIYVKIDGDKYYEYSNGVVSLSDIKSQKDIYLVDKDDFVFVFDKKVIPLNTTIDKINAINLGMFFVFLIITIISFFIVKKKILNLLLANIHKLKSILKQLNKYDEGELENKKGFDQLDFIVNAFDDAINEKTKEYLLYDALTGMLNRRGLEELYKAEVDSKAPFAIIFIDLNNFKNINDEYGHIVGDEYLIEFSKKLSKAIEKRGAVARIAGDEFIVLLRNFKNKIELEEYFKRKVINLFKKERIVNNKFYASFSSGVAIYPSDGEGLTELIKKSDYMMYENKNKGRKNELAFFDKDIFKKLEEKEKLSVDICTAIKKKELFLRYQPIVDYNGKIKKVEALLRWNNKELGMVSPGKFIEIAEKNGEIIKIGYWAINKVCKDINRLKEIGVNDLVVNVNVSAIQLLEENFAKNVKSILDRNNIEFNKICIEITESIVIEEDKTSFKNIERLKSYGIQISLDDFGTGYTSFSYLEKFAGNSLKIDKTILDSADDNEYHIIGSIKEIGEELNFDIVIEGVETKEQFEKLCEIGFRYFQGFYFSRPIGIEELEQIYK
ncbi:bifunctional diguanylate cyclase/phosphodiesterase [Paraclostridium bifermentans]|uniref:bifunctional diguanylate cyclase/phosphodiesterase n=1 Tax=Paraclostridium bifermentans TaxID=1490 RepID=UPI00359C8820